MPRALFEKTGNAVYISHLDLMRIFQRAFKRAGLPLTHTQGFNPRPSVSIALPLSLGVESHCELLDFDLEGQKIPNETILEKLNGALIDGVRVLAIYDEMTKLKYLAYLDCRLVLEYDSGIPADAKEKIMDLFSGAPLLVEKKSKNGVSEQDIRPMILQYSLQEESSQELIFTARICCQNPSLNPMQITNAICKYLPELAPDFVRCCRMEIFNQQQEVFR